MALQTPQKAGVHAKGDEHGPAEGKIDEIVHEKPLIRGWAI
jgi:hypothetical protein